MCCYFETVVYVMRLKTGAWLWDFLILSFLLSLRIKIQGIKKEEQSTGTYKR